LYNIGQGEEWIWVFWNEKHQFKANVKYFVGTLTATPDWARAQKAVRLLYK